MTSWLREDSIMSVVEVESGWTRRRIKLVEKYEQISWNLFAAQGFYGVTVDEIAEATGVSARTLFRYFPSKDDFLLGFPRRGTHALAAAIARLTPSPTPLQSVWQVIRDHSLVNPPDVRLLTLWRQAAADVPEIHHRVRGERVHELTEAVTEYCAVSFGSRIRPIRDRDSSLESWSASRLRALNSGDGRAYPSRRSLTRPRR